MAWTQDSNGTQLAVIGTEHILASPSTNATYVLLVDTSNMTGSDVLELRIYNKVLTAGSLIQSWKAAYGPGLGINPVVQSMFIPSLFQCKFTLKQVVGTGRNFDWSILRQ